MIVRIYSCIVSITRRRYSALISFFTSMEMELMALQAYEWLILFEKVICYASVWVMTDTAVLGYRLMLKNIGPLVTRVALKT
jgi:hypothetical protein